MINISQKITLTIAVLFSCITFSSAKIIPLNNPNIYVNGAAYVIRSPEKLFYKRFSDSILNLPDTERMFMSNLARSTSGVNIQFKTNSASIHLTFSPEPGLSEKGYFGVLRDGVFYKTVPFTAANAKGTIQLNLDSLPLNKAAVYEIILPSYSNLALTGFELDDNSQLIKYHPIKKPIYISFGDSITHGRGQDGASYLTYPYLLSQKLNAALYNLGIGGSRISVPIAKMSADLPQANVITILIGYNDFNGESKTVNQFEKDYREFLTMLRNKQKNAKIFCISLLYTKKTVNPKTNATPAGFRNVLEKLVQEFQQKDKKIYFVAGEKLTSLDNLTPGENTDAVHLTVKGAAFFADKLYNEIQKNL